MKNTLGSLSSDEKELLKSKQITGERTPDEWLALFAKMRDFDKRSDSRRSWGGGIGCLGLVLAFLGLVLTAVFPPILLLVPVGVIAAVVGIVIYFRLKGYDIPGEVLTDKVIPILMILREDMPPPQQLKMRLDLRGFTIQEKLRSESKPYAAGVYHKIVDKFYQDQWFDGETTLADGTRLIWSVTDSVRRREKSKRNPRGKHKHKTKDAHRTFISMQIGMKSRRYALPEKLKQKGADGNIRTKSVENYDWMSVRRHIKHAAGQTFHPTDFVNAIASAYVRAQPQNSGRK